MMPSIGGQGNSWLSDSSSYHVALIQLPPNGPVSTAWMAAGPHTRLRRLRCSPSGSRLRTDTCLIDRCQNVNDSRFTCPFAADNRVRGRYFDTVHLPHAIFSTQAGVSFLRVLHARALMLHHARVLCARALLWRRPWSVGKTV